MQKTKTKPDSTIIKDFSASRGQKLAGELATALVEVGSRFFWGGCFAVVDVPWGILVCVFLCWFGFLFVS